MTNTKKTTKKATKKPSKKVAKKPAAAAKKPAKKATKKATPAKDKPKAVKKTGRKLRRNEDPHPRRLRGALLYELRAAALSVQLKQEKLETVNASLNAMSMNPEFVEVFKLLSKRTALSSDIKDVTLAFVEVQRKLSAKFNIPLERIHEYTFNTDTGAITPSKIT